MRVNLGQLIVRNWPIKLAALFLSVMLYIAVAAQQPTSQLFSLKLEVEVPPGRTITQKLPIVAVQITGKGSELLKLRAVPPVIKRTVPDTLSASVWLIRLQESDVQLPRGADVRINEIVPRDVEVVLDPVTPKDVRIVPRIAVVPDSGYMQVGGLTVVPSIARIVGPEPRVAAIESVTTVPVQISDVTGAFSRVIPIDTAVLGVVRVAPKQVEVTGRVAPIAERSFAGIPVETGAGALTSFVVSPARVAVSVRGADSLVQALTRDSLRVVAHLSGPAQAGAYARLSVVAPRGITGRAIPDSAVLRRRSRGG